MNDLNARVQPCCRVEEDIETSAQSRRSNVIIESSLSIGQHKPGRFLTLAARLCRPTTRAPNTGGALDGEQMLPMNDQNRVVAWKKTFKQVRKAVVPVSSFHHLEVWAIRNQGDF